MISMGPNAAALGATIQAATDLTKIATGQKDPAEFGNMMTKTGLKAASAGTAPDFSSLKLPPVANKV